MIKYTINKIKNQIKVLLRIRNPITLWLSNIERTFTLFIKNKKLDN